MLSPGLKGEVGSSVGNVVLRYGSAQPASGAPGYF